MTVTLDENLTITSLIPYEDDGDVKNHRTHIVNPPMNMHIWEPGMDTREIVEIARMTDQFVVALCGYRWVPKRNPDKYDACSECMKIAGMIIGEVG